MRVLNRKAKGPALCLKRIISDPVKNRPQRGENRSGKRPPSKVAKAVQAETSVATTTGMAVICTVFFKKSDLGYFLSEEPKGSADQPDMRCERGRQAASPVPSLSTCGRQVMR